MKILKQPPRNVIVDSLLQTQWCWRQFNVNFFYIVLSFKLGTKYPLTRDQLEKPALAWMGTEGTNLIRQTWLLFLI